MTQQHQQGIKIFSKKLQMHFPSFHLYHCVNSTLTKCFEMYFGFWTQETCFLQLVLVHLVKQIYCHQWKILSMMEEASMDMKLVHREDSKENNNRGLDTKDAWYQLRSFMMNFLWTFKGFRPEICQQIIFHRVKLTTK